MTGANVITLYSLQLVPMQVSNVLETCRRLMQLLILYLQLSQMTITELGLLLSRHLTVVVDTMHYPSLQQWISHGRRCHSCCCRSPLGVPVCANPIDAHVVTWLIREAIMACHVNRVLGEL